MKQRNPMRFCVVIPALAGRVFGILWKVGKMAPRIRVTASPP